MSIYNYLVRKSNGEILSMETYRGKTILIVNTASQCQFTYQFDELQKLYDRYKERNFVILGFPCDQFGNQNPENGADSLTFCQRNYGVTFPVFDLVYVNGVGSDPLFSYLKHEVSFRNLDETVMTEKLLLMKIKSENPEHLQGRNIKWNFTKFLISSDGEVVKRFEPTDSRLDIEEAIEQSLAEKVLI
ncbi:glutathione peroxidase [Bacillus sp. FJAT-50079]|uniref:glutathione peroxidase n=1 Tax=Bacillus sp. FJAT-50079 TaxID=2833577 RepID=UPI001BC9A720|nr:glutathione peroxidase [Bacillus sp. FJAT-50079]MBS4209328.1 glutathione peroxidase [Bacillus sp. FJAT-50079]